MIICYEPLQAAEKTVKLLVILESLHWFCVGKCQLFLVASIPKIGTKLECMIIESNSGHEDLINNWHKQISRSWMFRFSRKLNHWTGPTKCLIHLVPNCLEGTQLYVMAIYLSTEIVQVGQHDDIIKWKHCQCYDRNLFLTTNILPCFMLILCCIAWVVVLLCRIRLFFYWIYAQCTWSEMTEIKLFNQSCYWPFVRGIHRWPVASPHKGQWRGALMFSLICAWTNDWPKTGNTDDLRCHRVHYEM